ncbi:hypothetical protein ACJ7K1_16940 [Paenibacillus elgii]
MTKEKALEIIENELGVKGAKKSGILANMKRNNEVTVRYREIKLLGANSCLIKYF